MAIFPVLYSKRLVLREFHLSDAHAVFDIFSHDSVTKYHNNQTMHTIDPAIATTKARMNAFPKGLGIRWAIVLRENPETLIGSCGYFNLNKFSFSAETGYDLHPVYWRKGIMTEALTTIINYAYSDAFFYALNRIEALTYVEHIASAGLLLKLGFQEEGTRRACGYWKGAFHDLRVFSLLRADWMIRDAA